jgi:tRNA (cytidine/uridine-2'-O-)-methyltransferase
MIRFALYQPDIPQNTGTILRMARVWDSRSRSSSRPASTSPTAISAAPGWITSTISRSPGTPPGGLFPNGAPAPGRGWCSRPRGRRRPYTDFRFATGDILLLGRESAGVPDEVHAAADARVAVPMRPGLRSLNVAVAAAMIAGEALRQMGTGPSVQEQEAHQPE